MENWLFDDIVSKIQSAYTNLFYLAIKKKINLRLVVESATEIVEDYIDGIDGFTPVGIEGVLFLSTVAKMMDYSLFDIVYLSESEKESIIRSIIDTIEISDIEEYELSDETNSFVYDYWINNNEDIDFELTFEDKNQICSITARFYMENNYGFDTDYMYDTVVLWSGDKGDICKFVVEMIEDLYQADEESKEVLINEIPSKKMDSDESIIDYKDFFIYSNQVECNHECIKVLATVPVYAGWKVKTITFEASYCAECGVYYISEWTYKNKILSVGRLLCQVMSSDEYDEYKRQMDNYGELKPQSVLNMIGYNVNSKEDLSEHERQTILRYAIESGIITKKLAIFYLQTFIKKNSPKQGLKNAVEKWKSDLQWLHSYDGKGNIIYGVKRVITNKSFSMDKYMTIPEDIETDLPFK